MGTPLSSFELETIGRIVCLPFFLLTYFNYLFSTNFGYLYRKLFMDFLLSLIVFNILKIGLNIYFRTEDDEYYDILIEIFDVLATTNLLLTNVLCLDFWLSIRNLILRNGKRADKTTYIKCSIYVFLGSLFELFIRIYYLISTPYSIRMADDWSHKLTWICETLVWMSIILKIIVILSNFWMLTHATIIVFKEIRLIRNLSGSNVLRNKDDYKKKLFMCVKLFTVSIISLVFSPLLADVNYYFIYDSQILYDFLKLGNTLQGLFLFMVFTLKKRNIFAFKKWVFNIFSHKNTNTELNSSENQVNKENCRINANIRNSTEITMLPNRSNQMDA